MGPLNHKMSLLSINCATGKNWMLLFLLTLRELQQIRCVFEHTSQFWLGFIMVVYEKIYFKAYTNDLYISHKNNFAQLYFISGRAELHWNFSSWLRDASDIHRFPALYMVKTRFLLGNLWISKPSLSILEKFQHSLALPDIKHNCAKLFLCEMYRSFVYALRIYFLIDHHYKNLVRIDWYAQKHTEFTEVPARCYCSRSHQQLGCRLLVYYSGKFSQTSPFSKIDINRGNVVKYGVKFLPDVQSVKDKVTFDQEILFFRLWKESLWKVPFCILNRD